MVEKANRATAMLTKHRAAPAQHHLKGQNGQPGAVEGRSLRGPRCPGRRRVQMQRPVTVQTTMVSKKVPVMLM